MSFNEEIIIIDVNITAEQILKKSYVCSICLKPFNSDQSLKKHLLINHYQLSIKNKTNKVSYRFLCPVINCKRSLKINHEYFTSRKHLIQHFFKVHNTQQFSCSNVNCDKKFSTEMLRNLHLKNCGKVFICHCCNCCFNSKEALQTHQKRKHPKKETQENNKRSQNFSVSTTTAGLDSFNSSEKQSFSLSTTNTIPILSTKSTITEETFSPVIKVIKNSSTSTSDDFNKEENSNSLSSSSSQTKKNLTWSGDFDDSLNIFDNEMKLEFYTAETQTDFAESLLNNNYTQTTFNDLYDFEKFDIQTQTNWDE